MTNSQAPSGMPNTRPAPRQQNRTINVSEFKPGTAPQKLAGRLAGTCRIGATFESRPAVGFTAGERAGLALDDAACSARVRLSSSCGWRYLGTAEDFFIVRHVNHGSEKANTLISRTTSKRGPGNTGPYHLQEAERRLIARDRALTLALSATIGGCSQEPTREPAKGE